MNINNTTNITLRKLFIVFIFSILLVGCSQSTATNEQTSEGEVNGQESEDLDLNEETVAGDFNEEKKVDKDVKISSEEPIIFEREEWQVGPSSLETVSSHGDLIGLTVHDDTIYVRGTGEKGSRTLYKSEDRLETLESIYTFEEAISHMLITPFGYFVQGNEFMYKSVDKKDWEAVFELPTNTFLRDGWDYDPENEIVYFGDYHLGTGVEVNVHRGLNGGEDWEVAFSFEPDDIRHLHSVQYDPYSGYLWLGTGDSDEQSRVYYTKDNFETLELVAKGSQDYRIVTYAFTEDYIYWGADAPSVPQKIMRISRNDYSTVEEVGVFMDKPFYFTHVTNDGIILKSTVTENIESIEKDGKNRVFAIKDGEVQEVLAMKTNENQNWARLYPFGEDSEGYLYFSGIFMEGGPTNEIFIMKLDWQSIEE